MGGRILNNSAFGLIADVAGVARPGFPLPRWSLALLAELFDLLHVYGLKLPVDGNQMRRSGDDIFFDGSKAWAELCRPQIDMRQSLADTYAWYLEHGYIKPDAVAQFIDYVGRIIGAKSSAG